MSNTNKYNNTIIYKIYCIDCDECYIGHTTDFKQRKRAHKHNCHNVNSEKYNMRLYEVIRKYGDWDNWIMEEIETCNCNDFKDALEREEYWYNQLKPTLNSVKPNFDRKQYSQLPHVKVLHSKYSKEYYEKNKEKINKECYEKNKEYYFEKNRRYYEKNKEKISEKNREKITCCCGAEINKRSLTRHQKTKKHLNFINII